MYFRYYLSDAKENNTLETLVDALILSSQLNTSEFKDFLFTCFDRMRNGEVIELCLEIINKYCQTLTIDLYETIEDQSRQEEAQRISKVLYSLDELKRTLNAKLIIIKYGPTVNNPPLYFEITHDEFSLYEKYKGMSSSFYAFFTEFRAQGQENNARSRKNRVGSRLKYEFILPEERSDTDRDSDDDEITIEIVDDETQAPTYLPQFEQLAQQTQASSSATASCSTEEPSPICAFPKHR